MLDADALTALVQLGTTLRASEATVRDDLSAYHSARITSLDVGQWIQNGELDLAGARQLIGQTAKKREWFKSIANGEALGEFVWARIDSLAATDFGAKLEEIKQQIYDVEPSNSDD
ncbi:hypothetical protein [Mycobacteroides abscessus]|uniref:hypothetical protein n=1 Tax=Mycobacteroides abscessus TaxID=36809 RepID=UPI00092C3327|nr:hypothetical protein [Mycobacteroides abscessus]MCU8691997.1 hypothetical protein [Mycobacteroides abscessus]MCU8711206.1 hypothetical protein [Mycobacteroides abscessus]MCU8715952.1 hypothetical protein [Mycobacteroides abscessus]MCU8749967.1 hypothetical protein [Mycobacteroides abscessus]MCU8760481.1 hypothetical protein [Mycobacteroides abscessus]